MKTDNTMPDNRSLPDKMDFPSIIENDKKYHLLRELSTDAIVIVQDHRIKECNHYMAKICDYRLEEVVDTCFASFFHSDDIPLVESLSEGAITDPNGVKNLEAKLVCKNSHQINVEITAALCTFRQKPATICIIRDISQRLKTEAKLKNHRALDSIAALSGGIAHDYNNLLTAIIGNITLAQTYLDPEDKPFKLLGHALVASNTAKKLTQKLITFSKGGSPNKAVISVDRLVKGAVDFTLSGSNIKSSYSFAPDLWLIDVDQSQVGQAVHNVVMNAREAMPHGGHLKIAATNITVTESTASLPRGTYVKISIADQGCGLASEEFDKIFAPYYSTKVMGDKKGMGLGLAICQSIIRKHGGNVSVESQIGVGSTFNIFLPTTHVHPAIKSDPAQADGSIRLSGERKILVMDDDQMIRELAGEILQHLGCRVEFARDGAEAIASYQAALESADPFDAVILDLTVRGGMGGKEAIQKLKAIDPNVKGILSSGYSEDPEMTGFEQYGFSDIAAKPYSMEELGIKLSKVLRSKPK